MYLPAACFAHSSLGKGSQASLSLNNPRRICPVARPMLPVPTIPAPVRGVKIQLPHAIERTMGLALGRVSGRHRHAVSFIEALFLSRCPSPTEASIYDLRIGRWIRRRFDILLCGGPLYGMACNRSDLRLLLPCLVVLTEGLRSVARRRLLLYIMLSWGTRSLL